jgi:hypothetical protein
VKRLLTYSLCLLLSMNVLVASVGLPFFVQTCQMTGKTNVSLVPRDCCEQGMLQAGVTLQSGSCCQKHVNYLKSV